MPDSGKNCDCAATQGPCRNETELEKLQQRVVQLEQEILDLRELVRTDALTGLYNQRYFREALHREIERTQRTGEDFCLILMDLDHFKNVNDTWGHEVGNLALQHTAALIRDFTRTPDIPCRYGGEEFAILLPGSPLGASVAVAERIRAAFESTAITVEDKELHITASFGVCSYCKAGMLTEEQLVETADRLLYQAKDQGRNQVCWEPARIHRTPQVSQDEKDLLLGLGSSDED